MKTQNKGGGRKNWTLKEWLEEGKHGQKTRKWKHVRAESIVDLGGGRGGSGGGTGIWVGDGGRERG